jgi:hypothetical protein
MKKKTKVFIILGAAAVLIISIVFAFGIIIYTLRFLSSDYGIAKISVSGRQLYFRRERRGLNYDSVILSADGNYCAEYNPELDYRFTTEDPAIYYKIDSDTLYLLSGNPTLEGYEYNPEQYLSSPKNFPVKVVVVKPDKLIIWEKRKELYQNKGMEFLELPLDETLKCYFK